MSIGHLRLLKLQPRTCDWFLIGLYCRGLRILRKNKLFLLKELLGFQSLKPFRLLVNSALCWNFLVLHLALCAAGILSDLEMCLGNHPLALQHTSSVQLLSCLTLCDPMDCSTPGLPVRHQLPEFTQTQVHWVGDAIQPSYPLSFYSSLFPPAFNLSQQQCLFKWVNSSHQVAKVLEFKLQHQSFQSIFRINFL